MLRANPELWCVTTFIYLLAFFIVQNFKKILTANRVMTMRHFWAKNGSFAPKKSFFWKKLLISFSSTYWPLSLCKILKKFLQQIQSYEYVPFLSPKWPIYPNEVFFHRKPVNKPCSFHSCLSSCQKSKSGINLSMKYLQLKNNESWLAEGFNLIIGFLPSM